MTLTCLSEYHNGPASLHFEAGIIEVTDDVAAYLLHDAPDNFTAAPPITPPTSDAPTPAAPPSRKRRP